MYNYRYDANGRAINMNGLAQWDTSGYTSVGGKGGKNIPEGMTPKYEADASGNPVITGYELIKKKATKNAKNGSIVKAMRNL
jgi:hypothetical protein